MSERDNKYQHGKEVIDNFTACANIAALTNENGVPVVEFAKAFGISYREAITIYSKVPKEEVPIFTSPTGTSLDQLDSPARQVFLDRLQQFSLVHPGEGIILQDVAYDLGISRQAASQQYNKLLKDHMLPPLAKSLEQGKREERYMQVANLKREGKTTKRVAEDLGEDERKVSNTVAILKRKGIIEKERRRRKREELQAFDRLVKDLYQQKIPYDNMAEQLEAPMSDIINSVNRLIKRNEIERRQKRKKVK